RRLTFRAILALAGKYVANAADRIVHVPWITGNNMEMQLVDRLTGGLAFIHADVETFRAVSLREVPLYRLNQPEAGHEFVFGQFGGRGNGALGHDERMAFGDGKAVPDRKSELVLLNPPRRLVKG